MVFEAKTRAQARILAKQLRFLHEGTDWVVRIHRPLFAGDAYRVTVGL